MKQYWFNLSLRDRWALAIGVVVVSIYLFYTLVLSSLWTAVDSKAQLYVEKKQTLLWMDSVKNFDINDTKAQKVTNTQFLTIVSTQLKEKSFKTYPFELQQTGTGDVQLTFESVPFNMLMRWLYKLNTTYQFEVKQLKAERLATPGLVKMTIVLSA
tara:strand:- start:21 stop:488 length:468 start_codon:yes stop_codon:yes gene_type:complete